MPLTTIASYLTVCQTFVNHWDLVNTALGGGPSTDLKLKGGYTVANLTSDRAALDTMISTCAANFSARQTSANARDIGKSVLLPHLANFRAAVKYQLSGSKYVDNLPTLPSFRRDEGEFMAPFRVMAGRWAEINADSSISGFTPPMILVGGLTLAAFNTALAAQLAVYVDLSNKDDVWRTGNSNRDILLKPLRTRLEQYRIAVPAKLGLTHALTLSLPVLYPAPGSTPNPVSLAGLWNAGAVKASLTCTPPDDPHFDHISVRYSPSPYRTTTESTIGTLGVGVLNFLTDVGLAAPGASAEYKFYVVTTTGNEKGSNTVRVTRPV